MAEVDYFLRIDGVEGESQVPGHKGEIQIDKFACSAAQKFHGGAAEPTARAVPLFGDFQFSMRTNKATPRLFQACLQREKLSKVILTARKAGKDQQPYYKWTLRDAYVTGVRAEGGGREGVIPTDEVTLDYAELEIEYREQLADGGLSGPMKFSYSRKSNR